MQFKTAQKMIQEVVEGKDADDIVKTFLEGESEGDDVVEEKPETPVEKARKFLSKRGVSSK